MPKIHQIWPGKNRFACGMITGPIGDICANCYVYGFPFSIFVTPKVWLITPFLPISFYIMIGLTILFLLLTSCTDPGIIPRRPFLQRLNKNLTFSKYLYAPQNQQDRINIFSSSNKLCHTCQIYRPRRASHCSACNNCVQVFDHHCPFVNNCVGKRNYRFFFLFLGGVVLSIVILAINLIIFAIYNSGSEVNPTVVIVISAVGVGVLAVPLICFLIFHIYLAIRGTTTRQLIKNISNDNNDEQLPQNQWLNVDPPLMDYYEDISQVNKRQLQESLNQISKMTSVMPVS